MSDFTISGGVASIHDAELYSTWQDRPDYIDAMVASEDPEVEGNKRVLMEFEAALARMVKSGAVDAEVDTLLERYVAESYRQHDPNIADGRSGLAEFFRLGGFGDTPPAPVALTVEGELVSMVLQMPEADPVEPGSTYDRYFLSLFRVRDGLLVEHWDGMPKLDKGQLPMEAV